MNTKEEFYIGWEDKAPSGIGWPARWVALLLVLIALAASILFAVAQRTIASSVFEWGKVKSFTGILRSHPCPHLLVPRPGAIGGQPSFSTYYLVNPFKFGFDPDAAARWDNQSVSLKGTLIYRGNQTMIEVAANSIKPIGTPASPSPAPVQSVSLGRQTLTGEIVDSKCFLGVMNPGALAPHRACAIRCISGGIPPILLVRPASGPALHFLLTSPDGHPVNKQILDRVAEPVTITGEVIRQGDLLILGADPATVRRVSR
jgi:hypothetical protein